MKDLDTKRKEQERKRRKDQEEEKKRWDEDLNNPASPFNIMNQAIYGQY